MSTRTDSPIDKSKVSNQTSKVAGPNVAWSEVAKTLEDFKQAFGFIPTFVKNVVETSLPGAWAEVKVLRFGTNTALDTKLKGLIALAVGSQIPCDMISYFEQNATVKDGATLEEQKEAVMMAAITRHWSTVLNGSQLDKTEFNREVSKVMSYVQKMMEQSKSQMPPREMFLVRPTTADDAYADIEKTLGLVPKFFLAFPKIAIAGAWSEFKALQLNPYTVLSGKQKELIGLAVGAQIPCDYCITFHKSAGVLNGASEQEIQEAIAIAATTRHWSAMFHGPQMTLESFQADADRMIKNSAELRLQ